MSKGNPTPRLLIVQRHGEFYSGPVGEGRRQKNILVTGGAGFLGSHLCERLLEYGHNVICVDNFVTGLQGNIAVLREHPAFRVLVHDVIEPLTLQVDQIYNLACPASPPKYQRDPIHTLKTSCFGAINLLDLAVRSGARILQASTSEVYGDPQVHPQAEAYWGHVNPFGPRACYDEGKRCAETLFYDYQHHRDVDARVARIFNTYGPRMRPDDGRVVSNFIVQALQGRDITIYGDGRQTRSFCYVDDLIDGLIALMDAPMRPAGPINLGNPGEFTIRELADLIVTLCASRSKVAHQRLPVDDPCQRCPDITLAQRVLGWSPQVPLAKGLKRTIAHFESALSIAGDARWQLQAEYS